MFDYLICHGKIVDGSGKGSYFSELAVKDGKIAAIGNNLGEAAQVVDAAGCCVTPGFIDIHRHGDAEVFREGFGELELRQGLTSIINGACGLSLSPFGDAHRQALLRYLQPVTGRLDPRIPTDSMAAYLSALKNLPIHVGMMVGGGTVRTDVCGYRAEDPDDFSEIHRRLEKALSEGALAVSLGLGYAPECFYSTESLTKALQPLKNSQIPLAVHMREEGDMVCEALSEMICVAKALSCPLHISHLKAMGKRNWRKKIPRALKLMEHAREDGLDVSCDVYLYEAGSTQLLHLLPPDFLEGGVDVISERLKDKGQRDLLRERIKNDHNFDNIAQMIGWENIILSSLQLPQHQGLIGKTMEEAAECLRLDPVDALCRILSDERCAVTMIDRINCEEDICRILKDPFSSVISDATYPTTGLPHPRVYATYARLIEKYVQRDAVLSLEEAVRKVTSLPARSMRLNGKGELKVGMDADINIFRLEALHEAATFQNPRQFSEGMDFVFVGGKPAIARGELTSHRGGTIL
ncbi:MAG: amidohydrolase family protein [Oscillospiraceae bacterium]|nr:amidohydrolase family protein [Oscillospiraceae bacterium]